MGVTAFILIFLYIQHDLQYDKYNDNYNRIYRLGLHGKMGDNEFTQTYSTPMFAQALLETCPEVESTARVYDLSTFVALEHNEVVEKKFEEKNFFSADPSFFEIFTFETLAGKPKEALMNPNTLVITRSSAKRYFGEDIVIADVIGKTLMVDWGPVFVPFSVEAVIEDVPDQSHFHFDFLHSSKNLPFVDQDNWWNNSFKTYILLQEGKHIEDVEAKFYGIHKKHMGGEGFEKFLSEGNIWESFTQPLADIHLKSNLAGEFEANGNYQYLIIFTVAAIFLIFIACVNFVNLSTAKASSRAKEIGVRKVIGSFRRQLVVQHLTESLMACMIAINFALIFTSLLLPAFNSFVGKQLQISYLDNWYTIPSILSFTILIGLIAGIYPALYLTSFRPAQTLKTVKVGGRGSKLFRNVLVVSQFAISIMLIISTFVVYDQLNYIQNKNLGFIKDNILVVENVGSLENELSNFRNDLQENAAISITSSSSHIIGQGYNNLQFRPEGYDTNILLDNIGGDHEYDDVFEFEMVSGRYFSHEYPSDSFGVVINKEAALSLGWENPIGKELKYGGERGLPLYVIGVVDNFHYVAKHQLIKPMAIIPSFNRRVSNNFLSIKLENSNIRETVFVVEDAWSKYAGDTPFEYYFFDEAYDELYRNEQYTMSVFIVFSILTVFIAILGLVGLVIYSTEQRTKEIGIRKSMGASVNQVVILLSKDYAKWILIGFILSCPLAYIIIEKWLENFAYKVSIQWWVYPVSGILAITISWLAISFQAYKAAFRNPVDALRNE